MARLTLVDNQIGDMQYYLGDNPLTSIFNLMNMVQLNTKVDCGVIYMEIRQLDKDGAQIYVNETMFNLNQNVPQYTKFTVLHTEDLSLVGNYTFVTRLWLKDYRGMKITGETFVV